MEVSCCLEVLLNFVMLLLLDADQTASLTRSWLGLLLHILYAVCASSHGKKYVQQHIVRRGLRKIYSCVALH